MATTRTIKSKSRMPTGPMASVADKDLLSFVETSMKVYGTEVNLERSVPDFRDGLKPVVRRLLWAMHQLPGDKAHKSARLVGEVMGKYHPHGDSSIYGAAVTAVNNPVPPFTGIGNWGTLVDPAAAHRYTNIRMSPYGRLFFGKHYVHVTDMVPNFDRSSTEPLVLPCLLPNILFNGTEGIGVGVTTKIPAFEPATVLDCMIRLLDGEELTPRDYAKTLKFYYQYGGVVTRDKAGMAAATAFFSGTKGSIQWTSPLDIDPIAKTITLSKFAPSVDPVKLLETKVKPMTEVKSAIGGKGLSYVISARKDLNTLDFNRLVEKVKRLTSSKVSYEIYVTERVIVDTGDKIEYKVNFITCSIPELIKRWLKWRIQLEARSLDWQIQQTEKDIAYLKLLIYACDNIDLIVYAVRKVEDSRGYLVKKLKITAEEADQILDLRLRQLTKLDESILRGKLKEALSHLKTLVIKRKKPSREVRNFLVAASTAFTPYTEWVGTNQWALKIPTSKTVKSE